MRSIWLRISLVAIGVLAAPIVILLGQIRGSGAAPRGAGVWLDRDVVNFGRVPPAGERTATFRLKNTGNKKLVIWQLDKSCGCTLPELSSRNLSPSAEATIKVAFRAPSQLGPVHHWIRLYTDAPRRNVLTLNIHALVGVGVIPFPSEVKIGEVRLGNGRTRDLELYAIDHKPFEITGLTTNCKGLTIDAPLRQPKVSHAVKLIAASAEEPGLQKGQIIFATTHPECPTVFVPVEIEFVGRVKATPPQLLLGRRSPGERITAKVELTTEGVAPSLAAVACQQPGWQLDWKVTAQDNNRSVLELETLLPKTTVRTGLLKTDITLSFDEPKNEVLTLPVLVVLRNIGDSSEQVP